jgi:hypothetical protein
MSLRAFHISGIFETEISRFQDFSKLDISRFQKIYLRIF